MDAATLIRRARIRRGLTQARLARNAGTSQPVVSAYEHGRRDPSLETLRRLIAATGCGAGNGFREVLPGIEQQEAGKASLLAVAVIADDHDPLAAIDHRRTDPLGPFQARQAGNRDAACRRAGMAAPEPELELHGLARDRPADDEVSVEAGKPGHAAYPVAAEVQRLSLGEIRAGCPVFRPGSGRRATGARGDAACAGVPASADPA